MKAAGTEGRIGSYGAFELHSRFDNFDKVFRLSIKGAWNYSMEVGKDPQGNILRVTNALAGIERALPQVERGTSRKICAPCGAELFAQHGRKGQ